MSVLEAYGLDERSGGAFFLYGEDAFRKDEVVRALADAYLDPATRDFNLDPLRGTETDAETLASIVATPPMMAEWRVVVVREVEGLAPSPRAREVLLRAAASPPPGLVLVLSCTVPRGSKARFYKDLAKAATALELRPLEAADVPGWLMERGRERHGVEIEPDAAQALAAAVGAELGVLTREMEKLSAFVGNSGRVTWADVEAAGTRLPTQDRWRWFDLVGDGRFQEALDTLDVLLSQPSETGVGLAIGLSTHLLRLGVAAEEGPAALEGALPPHQRWLGRRLAAQARGWRAVELDAALDGLLRVDRLLKGSALRAEHVLGEWLLTLMARRAVA